MKKIYLFIPVLIVAVVGYWLYDYYAGNHIKIKEVIQAKPSPDKAGGSPTPALASGELSVGQLNKKWAITEESKVYFNVTTSKEAVTFVIAKVTGDWDFNLAQPDKMTAHAIADITTMDSGNSSRDSDIKGSQYLSADTFTEATFDLKSVEQWPAKWADGETVLFKMNGVLTALMSLFSLN
jgi:hypothetical protein